MLRGSVSDELLDRPKMGFGTPLADWFRNDLRDLAYDTLLSRSAIERELFKPAEVKRLLREHSEGIDQSSKLWDLLILELWYRTFVDQSGSSSVMRRESLG